MNFLLWLPMNWAWNNISNELFSSKGKKRSWAKGFAVTFGTVAVAAIMLFVLFTVDFTNNTQQDPNQNDLTHPDSTQGANDPDTKEDKGKQDDLDTEGDKDVENDPGDAEPETPLEDMFEHEKEMEIELEGMKERIHVQLATNDEWRYIIYVDPEGYRFTHEENVDKIVPIDELGDEFPEVAMEIQLLTDTTTEEVIANIKKSLENEGIPIEVEDSVEWPVHAEVIIGEGSEEGISKWDSPVHRYYITEVENGRLFVFKQMFFVEAWEGHASRFDWMLDSFEVVQ